MQDFFDYMDALGKLLSAAADDSNAAVMWNVIGMISSEYNDDYNPVELWRDISYSSSLYFKDGSVNKAIEDYLGNEHDTTRSP